MQKFLVIQTAFTGDVVLATALVEKLHRYFPDAQIDFLLRKGNEGLLLDHPFVRQVFIWNKREHKNRNLWKILKTIRNEKYDAVINPQRFASTGLLTAFSGAKEKIGFDKNPLSFLFSRKIQHDLSGKKHEVERNNELIQHLTDDRITKPRLYPSVKIFQDLQSFTRQAYVCMTPASVWFTKQYPFEKWLALINGFPSQYRIYLLGGKDDSDLCNRIKASTVNKNVEVLAGKLDFLSAAALMKTAVMNYTNDSAPLHFASAVEAPVTAIFCSTVPGFGFYPLSETSFVIETPEALSCRPCSLHGLKACPLGHFKCAYTIKTSDLLQTLPVSS